MENCPKGLKYAFSGRKEIHPCVLQDIDPLGPLPCSHSTPSADHSGHRVPLTMCDPWMTCHSYSLTLILHGVVFFFLLVSTRSLWAKMQYASFRSLQSHSYSSWSHILPVVGKYLITMGQDAVCILLILTVSLIFFTEEFSFICW